jgi:uncharacterized OB-fold protein
MDSTQLRTGSADAAYWQALSAGRLVMQHCQNCGQWHWPAVWRCGECGIWDPEWVDVALEGVVYSWTKTWHRFPGSEGIDLPYVTVLAALPHAGGRRLLGLYDGDEAALELEVPLQGRIGELQAGGRKIPCLHWLPRSPASYRHPSSR